MYNGKGQYEKCKIIMAVNGQLTFTNYHFDNQPQHSFCSVYTDTRCGLNVSLTFTYTLTITYLHSQIINRERTTT